ncbi:unnamed protein product [Prunus armeniaca]|uniref:TMV resistance protein N n=2 Tax=Prunus armeniaca TaxID=36596 RepID=A0A6J5VQX1_PRUAR|nr:unnamed protein product [Prunus armeniaca]
MGKEIVRQESPSEPGKRSRLWFYEDICHVLEENTGTSKIKGILMNFPEEHEISLSSNSFSKMKNLQLFINRNARFSETRVDYLPNELRLLDWPKCPLQTFPSSFNPKKLVEINMPRSSLSQLGEGFKRLQNLKSMSLEGCKFLTETPNFSGFPNLEDLNLNYCTSLVEVHPSVGFLDKLICLSMRGCRKLTKLPGRVHLKSLESIDLSHCGRLKNFPEIVGKMESLGEMNLSGTAIEELPSSINISFVSIQGANLSEIDFLGTLDCWSRLGVLDLSGSNFVRLPEWITKFVNMQELNLVGCKRLVEIPDLPPNISSVDVSGCISLERFPKLPNILEGKELQRHRRMDLSNCWRLLDIAAHFSDHFLIACKQLSVGVVFPGSEVPMWFNCRKNLKKPVKNCDISFEIPRDFRWEKKGLAISVAFETPFKSGSFYAVIHVNEEKIYGVMFEFGSTIFESTHVWLLYVPFCKMDEYVKLNQSTWPRPPFICRASFYRDYDPLYFKSCGVHLVVPQDGGDIHSSRLVGGSEEGGG